MSIVAVHGPYTFGSKAVAGAGPLLATVNPTNGLIWDFKLGYPTTRGPGDFAWTFPTDGTPSPQNVADPSAVTYATPGTKTAQCVVSNATKTVTNKALTSNVATLTVGAGANTTFAVGQSIVVAGVGAPFDGTYIVSAVAATTVSYAKVAADVASVAGAGSVTSDSTQVPAAGTYSLTVTAVSGTGGAGASLLSVEAPPLDELNGTNGNGNGAYYPSDHTVDEVKAEADANATDTAYIQSLLEAERAGKNRSTLTSYLEGLLTA